jgi:hypothetical protein
LKRDTDSSRFAVAGETRSKVASSAKIASTRVKQRVLGWVATAALLVGLEWAWCACGDIRGK